MLTRAFLNPLQFQCGECSLVSPGQFQRPACKVQQRVVLRLQVGAEVRVFDGRGMEIEALIVRASAAGVELALGQRHRVPLPLVSITLLQSVPRSDRMDIIVQKTTELGVTRIVPLTSSRTISA